MEVFIIALVLYVVEINDRRRPVAESKGITKQTPIGLGLAAGVTIGVASWAWAMARKDAQNEIRITALEDTAKQALTRGQMRALLHLMQLENEGWHAPDLDNVSTD